MNRLLAGWVGLVGIGLLSGCGGSGNNADPFPPNGGGGGGGINYTPGVFQPSSTFANQCNRVAENHFLRSWTNEFYLWYDDVPDLNPANYETIEYFDLLKVPQDRFHDWIDTETWEQLSQAGVLIGYGAQWYIIASTPPRQVIVAFTEPGSPAANAGLERGDEILRVDGEDLVNGDTQQIVDTLNAGLFPEDDGEEHDFRVRKRSGQEVDITMVSDEITIVPVQNVKTIETNGERVGYMLFNDHIATSQLALVEAIETLRDADIDDLVLDIRYNGGGYLDIASQLAYMIAGNSRTTGQVFERIEFNDKYPNTNPITGAPLQPTPFHTTTISIGNVAPGAPLPTLDLDRVYVLTTAATCSASEAIMNGLRGVNVDVYQIGSTTCGKPYGFYPEDNCDITYFSIQFQGFNAKDFGDYGEGFEPDIAGSPNEGALVSGCEAPDDFDRDLGDEQETMLATALSFRASNNQACPPVTSFAPDKQLKTMETQRKAVMPKHPFRLNRIYRDM